MKFLHLADLHIGKRFKEHPLLADQEYIFKQLVDIAVQEHVDAVLIAGDVFDKTTPTSEALTLCDKFFARFVNNNIPVFVIPGNHDSASQVAFRSALTAKTGLYAAKEYDGEISSFTIRGKMGEEAVIHLLPFIRKNDVRMALKRAGEDATADTIKTTNDAVRIALRRHANAGNIKSHELNILLAHQFVVDGNKMPETCDSETTSVGGIDGVEASNFDAFDYVALGHLHGAQSIRRPEVRYCGSPLKYSFSEISHKKAALIAEVTKRGGVNVHTLPLKPLHEVREVHGTLEQFELQRSAFISDDYVRVVLKDDSAYEAIQRLRVIFPNIVRLDWENTTSHQAASNLSLDDLQKKTPRELFSDFYQEQTGKELSSEACAVIDDVFKKVGDAE